jgi:hypothetical protein
MPHYEFYCEKCQKENHPDGVYRRARTWRLQVPGLWGQALNPLVGTFFSQTSRKA